MTEPFWVAHFEGLMVLAAFVIGAIGAYMGWQQRIVHKRIDKYTEDSQKRDEKLETKLDSAVEKLETKFEESVDKLDAKIDKSDQAHRDMMQKHEDDNREFREGTIKDVARLKQEQGINGGGH